MNYERSSEVIPGHFGVPNDFTQVKTAFAFEFSKLILPN